MVYQTQTQKQIKPKQQLICEKIKHTTSLKSNHSRTPNAICNPTLENSTPIAHTPLLLIVHVLNHTTHPMHYTMMKSASLHMITPMDCLTEICPVCEMNESGLHALPLDAQNPTQQLNLQLV